MDSVLSVEPNMGLHFRTLRLNQRSCPGALIFTHFKEEVVVVWFFQFINCHLLHLKTKEHIEQVASRAALEGSAREKVSDKVNASQVNTRTDLTSCWICHMGQQSGSRYRVVHGRDKATCSFSIKL